MTSESDSTKCDSETTENKREGKIFVGGLTWDTTVDDVKSYFRRFGDIIDATIIKDPISGRSRGFGFVVFDEEATMKKVFNVDNHYINGKKVDTKNAFRRNAEPSCRKIFVGGVDPLLPENEIREYFSSFGQIEEIDFPWDKEKNQRRAFCFVAFSSPSVVEEILKQSKHKLGDRMVDVKKATPKQENASNANNSNLALSIISQALSMNSSNSLNPNANLLANLLNSQQAPLLNNTLNGLNANPILPALAGLNYPLQAAANQSPGNATSNSNPYFALAAAAAAAGIYPPASPSVDIANWYSNIALAAAAAASQDGHGIVPAMLHQGSHRDNQQMSLSHHHNVSNNGSGGSGGGMIGPSHPGSSGNMMGSSAGGAGGVYGKPSRSASNLSPNTSGLVGTGVHRNAMQYHPYSR